MPFSFTLFLTGLLFVAGSAVISRTGESPKRTRLLSKTMAYGSTMMLVAVVLALWDAWVPVSVSFQAW